MKRSNSDLAFAPKGALHKIGVTLDFLHFRMKTRSWSISGLGLQMFTINSLPVDPLVSCLEPQTPTAQSLAGTVALGSRLRGTHLRFDRHR